MSTISGISALGSEVDVPVMPVPRAAHCPLHPPAEFAKWREEPGLRRAMYHGQPAWVVSRYQDIRAALLDPRLSADTIPAVHEAVGHRRQRAGDIRADR